MEEFWAACPFHKKKQENLPLLFCLSGVHTFINLNFFRLLFLEPSTHLRKVFDSDDGGGSDEGGGEGGDGEDVKYDKFGNVIDKAAAERAALQEMREAARAARAAKVCVMVYLCV